LKKPAFHLRVDTGKHFENGVFRKRWLGDDHVTSITEVSSNTNLNDLYNLIVAFLNSFGVVWTASICCVFRVKPPLSISSGVVWIVGNAAMISFSLKVNVIKQPPSQTTPKTIVAFCSWQAVFLTVLKKTLLAEVKILINY